MTSLRLFSRPRPPTLISLAPSSAPMTREAAGPATSWTCAPAPFSAPMAVSSSCISLEALSEVGVWRALKRTLNHNRLEIQPLEMFYPFGGSAQKPEAIDINVKVILIGDRSLYELLYEYEEDSARFSRCRVEFDEEMAMSGRLIRGICGRLRALKILRKSSFILVKQFVQGAIADEDDFYV